MNPVCRPLPDLSQALGSLTANFFWGKSTPGLRHFPGTPLWIKPKSLSLCSSARRPYTSRCYPSGNRSGSFPEVNPRDPYLGCLWIPLLTVNRRRVPANHSSPRDRIRPPCTDCSGPDFGCSCSYPRSVGRPTQLPFVCIEKRNSTVKSSQTFSN